MFIGIVFKSKCEDMRYTVQYLKVFFYTSLFWFFFVVCLFMYYTDCLTSRSSIYCQHRTSSENDGTVNYPLTISNAPQNQTEHHVEPGEMGGGVTFPNDLKKEVSEKFKINQFNLMASDLISVNRSLRDVRTQGCQMKSYPTTDLPNTTIIIVFHNEAWSTLLRTIWSVINRSPWQLVAEIILVDDASEKDFLGSKLDAYIVSLPIKIRIIRLKVRSGLVKARLKGASMAEGAVLTFLDAHCECSEGWLEPLLNEIYKNKTTVASPLIDVISDTTFEYMAGSDVTWGGFSWMLNFKWYQVPQREMKRRGMDRSAPIRTPVMAGGLFSIDKVYFHHIGSYDEGMDIWGGENLEMSFRIWMCGGQLVIVTCSRVGHVFRKATPYTFPGGTGKVINRNNARLAEVWLDEWKHFYYAIHPNSNARLSGNVSSRLELRKSLKCKSFRWYLENVFPESQMPVEEQFFGQIKNSFSGLCLDILGKSSSSPLGVSVCKKSKINQMFLLSRDSSLQNENLCLTSSLSGDPVKLVPCRRRTNSQKWTYDANKRTLKLVSSKNCLDVSRNASGKAPPFAAACTGDLSQQWTLISLQWRGG